MYKHLLAFQSPGRGDRIVTHDVSDPLTAMRGILSPLPGLRMW